MSKNVYLCGPIADCSLIEAIKWRADVSERLIALGHCPINPLHHVVFGRDDLIVETDKQDIDRSDVVLVYPWKVSVGTSMEVLYAMGKGKTVIIVEPDYPLSPWMRYHATLVVSGLDEALQVLAGDAPQGVVDGDRRSPLPVASGTREGQALPPGLARGVGA